MVQDSILENITELPSKAIEEGSKSLIGFDSKYNRIYNNLKLFIDQEALIIWSEKQYGKVLPIIYQLNERYPLVILAGDVGTGKTVMAEAIANRITKELGKDGFFLKLSTRVRGEGLHGQMGNLVNDAFKMLKEQAGKKRVAFLFIDEADAIATTRSTLQMHQEEKAAVNTLIQQIDEVRQFNGRAIVFMSTNRLHFLDEAIIRRAAIILEFERPTDVERYELFKNSLDGANFTETELRELAILSGPEKNSGLGHSFSDIRLKILPEVVASSFPNRKLSMDILRGTISKIKPSPKIK